MSTAAIQTTASDPTPVAAPPTVTAQIQLKVAHFRSIGRGPTRHTMVLTNPSETVSQPTSNLIRIGKGGAKLEFTIAPAEFRPVGIMFRNSRTRATVPTGSKHSPFRKLKLSGATLEITDAFPMPAPGQTPSPKKYKFSVLVQRVLDGRVGILDPEFENEHDTFDNDNEVEPEGDGEEDGEEE
jgi:hypothetical protein